MDITSVTKKRTSKKQFEIYTYYVEKNKFMVTGKLNPSDDKHLQNEKWEELAGLLNSCGDGPIRDSVSWKKTFTEWKSSTRKKAREGKTLNSQEEKLIKMFGSGAVTGLNIEEKGINEQKSTTDNLIATTKTEMEEFNGNENIVIEYIDENEEVPTSDTPKKTREKGRIRKTMGDVLCNAYSQAVAENSEKLDRIADSILEVAKAINRYCDITESRKE